MFLSAAAFHDDNVITCVSVLMCQFYRYGAKTELVSKNHQLHGYIQGVLLLFIEQNIHLILFLTNDFLCFIF